MPITGPSSYVSTTQEFLTHWTAVNIFLGGAGPLVLPNPLGPTLAGITVANFSSKRAELLARRDVVETADTALGLERAAVSIKKEWLHPRMVLFNEAVRGKIPLSTFARTLADVPGIDGGLEIFIKPMKMSRNLWALIDDDPPPPLSGSLILSDGTTQPAFATAVAELEALYDSATEKEQTLSLTLENRNDTQDVLYSWMKAYRQVCPAVLPAGNSLLDSMPQLTPTSGRTPDPVELSGTFDAVNQAADLNWPASNDPDLKEYEVRATFGPDYDSQHDHLCGATAPDAPRTLKTTKGLSVPGAVATYKVFVKLTSGGEAGSNPVVITRPA